MLEALFAKRSARAKWVAILPALIALFFAPHAFEDQGVAGVIPYISVLLLSTLYVFRPMLVLWAPVFAVFLASSVVVLVNPIVAPTDGPFSEWAGFVSLVVIATAALWFARPRRAA